MKAKECILIAPLNWGLGHATRCMPLIDKFLSEQKEVIIASDGMALVYLQKAYPQLTTLTLPAYNISYAGTSKKFKRHLIKQLPSIYRAIKAEHSRLQEIIATYGITQVISDNRLGLYSKKVPTVFITHQLTVLSGSTTHITTYLHQLFIKKFDECWVPDHSGAITLTGQMGHPKNPSLPVKYIGPLSRFQKMEVNWEHDLLVLLSGPEPQRSLLEALLLQELKKYTGQVFFVRGIVEEAVSYSVQGHIRMVNYLETDALQKALNASRYVLARSGYSTIMELATLGKKVFFIPTPGQTEQEYLAARFQKMGIAPFAFQESFRVKDLAKLGVYSGFNLLESHLQTKEQAQPSLG